MAAAAQGFAGGSGGGGGGGARVCPRPREIALFNDKDVQ
jgi:hypothetical protein